MLAEAGVFVGGESGDAGDGGKAGDNLNRQHHEVSMLRGRGPVGVMAVYVQPFPATGEKWKVSVGGGAGPVWRHDGNELFYRTGDGKMMAAEVKAGGGSFAAGEPRMLFQSSADPLFPNLGAPYSVSEDGQRFLINAAKEDTGNPPITVLVNWGAGAK